MGDEEVRSMITWMEVGDQIDSDHHPVVVTIRTGDEEKIGDTTRVGRRRKGWAVKGREIFRKETENMRIGMGGVEEEMKRGLEIMREAMEKQGKEEGGKWRSRWWDQECEEKKKEARKEMRKCRKGKTDRLSYEEKKREYKKLCEEKKREENEKWEREVEKARTEGGIWQIINREKRRRAITNEDITPKEWKSYFVRTLGGVERKAGRGDKEGRDEDDEAGIGREEIRKIIRALKEKKAVGVDEIPNEAWKHGGEKVEE
ncbi:hypothetical protein WN55_05906 [Dufourea novaeangliae]|uniref:Endonuclease/exonuclease/phosphatase domain-containing protein n=1 Tax=Dufourea novaeangliae TaxID=178035 RepID=A0A154P0I2_DUFNO|nr:hypothetical protein WN55_05906 [Dufourea novaeangliae]